jgi:hypothetical protein
LTLKATAVLNQLRAERDPHRKEQLRADLARLKGEKERLERGLRAPSASGAATGSNRLEQHARQVLQQNGIDPTPENLRTFIERNRNRLEQELRGGGRGGR